MNNHTSQYVIGEIKNWKQYHPTKLFGVPNPLHDDISQLVIGMKNGNMTYIRYFAEALDAWLPGGVVICTAPSSNPAVEKNGIACVGQILAKRQNRVDGTHVLRRVTDVSNIPRKVRTFDTHFNSIQVQDPELIRDKPVIVLDDVVTREHTLHACGEHIRLAKAKILELRAVARTVYYRDYYKTRLS